MPKIQKKHLINITPSWVLFLDLFKGDNEKWDLPDLSIDKDYRLSLLQFAIIHPEFVSCIGADKIKNYLDANRELLENYPFLVNFGKIKMKLLPKDDVAPLVYKGGDITFLAEEAYARYVVMTNQKKILQINGKNFIEIWRNVDKKCSEPYRLYNFFRGIDPAAAAVPYVSYVENGFYFPLCLFTSEITLKWVWAAIDGFTLPEEKNKFVEFLFEERMKMCPDLWDQLKCDNGYKSLAEFRSKCKNPLWQAFNPSEKYFLHLDKWHSFKKANNDKHIQEKCKVCSPEPEDFAILRTESMREQLENITWEDINKLGRTKKRIIYHAYKRMPNLFEGLSPAFKEFFNKEKVIKKEFIEKINEKPERVKTEKSIEWDMDFSEDWSPEPSPVEKCKRINGFPAAWMSTKIEH